MTSIKAWTLVICLVSIICTIFEALTPSGKMQKIFKFILGAFMLCSILIPFKNMLNNIKINTKNNQNITKDNGKLKNTVDDQAKLMIQKNIKSVIKNFLSKKSIKPEKINIFMDTDKDNRISIKKIEVFLSRGDENKKDTIKQDLEKILELKVEVVVGSE